MNIKHFYWQALIGIKKIFRSADSKLKSLLFQGPYRPNNDAYKNAVVNATLYCETLKSIKLNRLFIHKYDEQYLLQTSLTHRLNSVHYQICIEQNGRNISKTQNIAKDVQGCGNLPLHCVLELNDVMCEVSAGAFTISISGATTQWYSDTNTPLNDDCVRLSGQRPRKSQQPHRKGGFSFSSVSPFLGIEYEVTK